MEPPVPGTYLAGGTASALQIGHRESIDFDFFSDFVKAVDMPGFQAASLTDIALMKLVAVSQRGARKDFIDLYAIVQLGISLVDLLKLLPIKYPETQINLYHIIKSLIYFEDAEREPELRMLQPLPWESVKSFFLDVQRSLVDALH